MHGYGSMWPMGGTMIGWLLLTVLIVGLLVWLVVSYARPRAAGGEDTGRARSILAAQRRERARIRSERQQRWAAPVSEPHDQASTR